MNLRNTRVTVICCNDFPMHVVATPLEGTKEERDLANWCRTAQGGDPTLSSGYWHTHEFHLLAVGQLPSADQIRKKRTRG